ncbi:hypothetical protein PSI22_21065 [Xenorhabdus sp. XENO-7]|uniref:Uncharacterized protein n=1 Tax=Xenorhabdus aichiensis TaxID=3025874 RepID=A0ABT5M8M1_9GAMM|nr:hypothetical protein [Xenorhabdus aichiensis]
MPGDPACHSGSGAPSQSGSSWLAPCSPAGGRTDAPSGCHPTAFRP